MDAMAKNGKPVFRIIFVCTGNICRSPMAEIILRDLAERAGLGDAIQVSSAGTGEWHVGEQADPRTRAALARAGYSGEQHRARQFDVAWMGDSDLIVTFDRGQRRILRAWAENDDQRTLVRPLMSFDPSSRMNEVPDPYYGDDALFDRVRDMIHAACVGLMAQIEPGVRAALRAEAEADAEPVDN